MHNLTESELIQKATEIINQDWHTLEDIKKLSQIRYFLAIHYKRINTDGSVKEGLYNWMRAKETVELQNTLPVGKAENQAKSLAEKSYGVYREINANASGIKELMNTIESFVIALQVEQKTINNVQT